MLRASPFPAAFGLRAYTAGQTVSHKRGYSSTLALPSRVAAVTIYTGPQCSLCDEMKLELKKVQREHPFELHTYDIHDKSLPDQPKWQKMYIFDIPVLHVDGKEVLRHRITDKSRGKLLKALEIARKGQQAP